MISSEDAELCRSRLCKDEINDHKAFRKKSLKYHPDKACSSYTKGSSDYENCASDYTFLNDCDSKELYCQLILILKKT